MVHFSGSIVVALLVAATAPVYALSLRSSFLRRTAPLDPSTFPTQCQTICTPIIDTLNTCSIATCLCTQTNEINLEECVDCLIAADSSSNEVAMGQTVLDDFNNDCVSTGLTATLSMSTSASSVVPTTLAAATTTTASTSNPLKKGGAGQLAVGMVGAFGAVLVSVFISVS